MEHALEIAFGLARVVIDGGIVQHSGGVTMRTKQNYGACKHSQCGWFVMHGREYPFGAMLRADCIAEYELLARPGTTDRSEDREPSSSRFNQRALTSCAGAGISRLGCRSLRPFPR